MNELIAIAVMQRPELGARRAEIRAAIYALTNARLLPFSPNVILGFSSGGFGGGSNLVNAGIVQGNGSILQASRFGSFAGRSDVDAIAYWTLSNCGVGNIAMVRASRSRLEQSNLRELEVLNRIRAEVAEAYAMVHARFEQIGTLEESVKSGEESFREDIIRIRGQEGLPIELLDSLRLLGRAREQYLEAIIGYNIAQFQLYVALGQPPADSLARPVPKDIDKAVEGTSPLIEVPQEK
jgi:outer membrane protein TolC